ncbi:MAG: flagellar basal body L-ring protein FlgH [Alphaproteobacteria bacterium]|nr:flagellar basal body L-ring protein FlgH [Alphaproteobacteria bacterium]TAD88066.1 MAG: flagellar basal body L-ring protein FlgH [Alphaproteobacteria bacterium]
MKRLVLLALSASLLAGCSAIDRLATIGEPPPLSPIQNPQAQPGYQPTNLPMPPPQVAEKMPNSLWRPGARAFLGDQRASRVGDILTVIIDIDERGRLQNDTRRGRTNAETNNLTSLFGFQGAIERALPGRNSLPTIVDLESQLDNRGTGRVDRQERINLRLAALITQVLPNGNLVLHGRQETRLNFELRELQLQGVIRPTDISNQNTIRYDQIAEARVSYGGRGQITDVQQPRYGSQLLDILLPF